jgi:putative ABC transport system permease protein
VSVVLCEPPDLDGGAGGIVARRAVMRWGWRLFRREWRQHLLVLGLLTVAVAATIWGASAVTNAQLADPNYPTFGTAAVSVALPGSDPHLAADIAAIQSRLGPADVIENHNIPTGTTQSVQLRAESTHGHYTVPLLGLVSGAYPADPGQVALTSQVASLYNVHVGGTWQAVSTTWRVTGIVQDPSNLADEFALVAPGQITHPSKVTMLLGSAAAQQALNNGGATVPGVPAATLAGPNEQTGGPPQATLILVVEVLGLVFIGLVSVASFSVLAQRRLRALGMLSAIGATARNLRLVMIVNGLVVGVAGAVAGAVLGLAAWFAYAPALQQSTGHVIDAANLPWWAIAIGVVLAIATSVLASRRPAKTMAAVPVVTALSGRPSPRKAVHRSAVPGVIVFAAGLACLASSGGLSVVGGGGGEGGGGPRPGHTLLLLGGLVASIAGMILLAPLAISVLAAGAGARLPVAIRIALRDLVRYRARSGAALAATTFRRVPGHGDLSRRQHPVRQSAQLDRPQPEQQPALAASAAAAGLPVAVQDLIRAVASAARAAYSHMASASAALRGESGWAGRVHRCWSLGQDRSAASLPPPYQTGSPALVVSPGRATAYPVTWPGFLVL